MPSRWIEHKGRKVLYCDMRRLDAKQMLEVMKETDVLILSATSKILFLGNVEDATVSREVMQEARRLTSTSRRDRFSKMAAVGVTGLKGVFLDALATMFGKGVPVRAFKTEAEALDWLAE